MSVQQNSDSEINFNTNHPGNGDEEDVQGDYGDHINSESRQRYRRCTPDIKPDPGMEDWDLIL